MHDEQPIGRLSEAVALLTMLERLAEEFSRERDAQGGVPWTGIKLTLRQSRELVSAELAAGADPELIEPLEDLERAAMKSPSAVADSNLARRIRPLSVMNKG